MYALASITLTDLLAYAVIGIVGIVVAVGLVWVFIEDFEFWGPLFGICATVAALIWATNHIWGYM